MPKTATRLRNESRESRRRTIRRARGGSRSGDRLRKQIRFVLEIDKLKKILRRTLLTDRSRYENDAEHSWHFATMAIVLAEYANARRLDLLRVLRMILVHDLVEIDAGDTYVYDEKANRDKAAREQKAAKRIFGLLPADQAREFRGYWEEYEARKTPEAKFAAGLDRLQPLLHNLVTDGIVWRKHRVTSDRVLARNRHMGEGSRTLWAYAERRIRAAVGKGHLER